MKTFNRLLANSLVAGVTNSFLWFAVTFWAYLETRSVLATSIIGGSFMLLSAGLSLYFGTFVDHHRKKQAMLYSSLASFVTFSLAAVIYGLVPGEVLLDLGGLWFWLFVLLILTGGVLGNLRMIAMSTIFATFNNFLGGVFMSLMDPYGLNLVSVQAWGLLWGVLSSGFIIGGLIVPKKGLGPSPLRSLFVANIVMWTVSIFFTVKSSIVLLAAGMMIYMCLIPVIEAAEQTIIQRVVPFEKQGRVFGFAQSLESAAAPN